MKVKGKSFYQNAVGQVYRIHPSSYFKVFEFANPFYRKSSFNGKNAQYMSEDEFEFPKLMPIRA